MIYWKIKSCIKKKSFEIREHQEKIHRISRGGGDVEFSEQKVGLPETWITFDKTKSTTNSKYKRSLLLMNIL